MPKLATQLELERCPHCSVACPNIVRRHVFNAPTSTAEKVFWAVYSCNRCGGAIIATGQNDGYYADAMFPESSTVDDAIPGNANEYLKQAIESVHAPAGSVMLAASSVDAMLKVRGYTEGSLYRRIEQAAEDHLITEDMSKWAHEVRLEANDQRHADTEATLPTTDDAKRCIDFVKALGHILFVLPSRIQRGLDAATQAHSQG